MLKTMNIHFNIVLFIAVEGTLNVLFLNVLFLSSHCRYWLYCFLLLFFLLLFFILEAMIIIITYPYSDTLAIAFGDGDVIMTRIIVLK